MAGLPTSFDHSGMLPLAHIPVMCWLCISLLCWSKGERGKKPCLTFMKKGIGRLLPSPRSAGKRPHGLWFPLPSNPPRNP